MNIKEIVEGMTAPQVAQVIKDNFNEVDRDKANKTELNKSISDLTSVVEANKTDLTEKIDNNKNEADAEVSELGSKLSETDSKLSELGIGIVEGKTEVDLGSFVSGVVLTDGSFVASNNYITTDFILVEEWTFYEIITKCGGGAFAVSAYSNEKTFVDITGVNLRGEGFLKLYSIQIPVGVKYIRICAFKDSEIKCYQVGVNTIPKNINLLQDKINGFLQKISLNFVSGVVLADGSFVASNNYITSDFIKVSGGEIYKMSGQAGGGALIVSMHEGNTQSSVVVKDSYRGSEEMETISVNIPQNINYIRVSVFKNTEVYLYKIIKVGINDSLLIHGDKLKRLEQDVDLLKPQEDNEDKELLYNSFSAISPRKPLVLFQMDCNRNFYDNSPSNYIFVLKEYGVKHSVYNVLPEHFSNDSYLKFVQDLHNDGNEIAIHSDTQYDISSSSNLSKAEFKAAVVDYYNQFKSKGIDTYGWISLSANLKSEFKQILSEYVTWALTEPTDYSVSDTSSVENWLNDINSDIKSVIRVSLELTQNEATTENIQVVVDKAINAINRAIENKSYLIFYAHSYNATSAPYTLLPSVLIPVLSHLKSKLELLECKTGNTSELLNDYFTKKWDDVV